MTKFSFSLLIIALFVGGTLLAWQMAPAPVAAQPITAASSTNPAIVPVTQPTPMSNQSIKRDSSGKPLLGRMGASQ